MYLVRDVMSEDVLTISADDTVAEAIRRLIGNHISGMPVVDEADHLVGIISEFQLLEILYSPRIREMLVGEMMTKDVVTVTPSTTLSDAASLLVAQRIRRLPVIDKGRVVGIVARRDLLRYALEAGDNLDAILLDSILDDIQAGAYSPTCV